MNLDQLKQKYKDYEWVKNQDSFSNASVYLLKKENETLYLKYHLCDEPKIETEKKRLEFLKDKLPIPEIVAYKQSKEISYLITKAISGTNLKQQLTHNNAIKLMAKGLKMIHSIDITNYYEMSNYHVSNNDKEDLVFIHGDYCPVNIMVNQKENELILSGFIDFSESGIGNRYYDLAEVSFIIEKHFSKKEVKQFFDYYGIEVNNEKLKYHTSLFKQFNKLI